MPETRESYTFRIPIELRVKLQKLADAEGRSLSNLVILILRRAVENER